MMFCALLSLDGILDVAVQSILTSPSHVYMNWSCANYIAFLKKTKVSLSLEMHKENQCFLDTRRIVTHITCTINK